MVLKILFMCTQQTNSKYSTQKNNFWDVEAGLRFPNQTITNRTYLKQTPPTMKTMMRGTFLVCASFLSLCHWPKRALKPGKVSIYQQEGISIIRKVVVPTIE
jgi:hypothetical protein